MVNSNAKRKLAVALLEKRKRSAQTKGEPLDLLTWCALNRRLLKPGVPFDLTRHLYLVEIYQSKAQKKVIYKAGQMGASEYAISYSLHASGVRDLTTLYVFPTDRHVTDFSTARFGPAIEVSPALQRLVVDSREGGGKRGADRVTLKRIGDRFLYFRGAQVQPDGRAPQLKSVDADVLILDEVDEMDRRAPAIAEKRLGHSLVAERLRISTPTYPGAGIHEAWLESDQREWVIGCEYCGHKQELTIEDVVMEWDELERPVAWHGMEEGRAWAACRHCGKELNRLARGEWVPAYPGRPEVGYHLTKLFGAHIDLLEVVKNLDTANESDRKEAVNQDLGLPYQPRGGQLTDAELDACRREYGHGPVEQAGAVAGVDVGRLLHVVIRARADEKGERRQLFAGTVKEFAQVGWLMQRYGVLTCVVDGLPETREARRFQASFPGGVVWLAFYDEAPKYAQAVRWNLKERRVDVDRTRSLDEMYRRVYDQSNTLPANIQAVADYYEQMKAPVRTEQKSQHGEVSIRYIETGPDHYAHAENYCAVASSRPAGWVRA